MFTMIVETTSATTGETLTSTTTHDTEEHALHHINSVIGHVNEVAVANDLPVVDPEWDAQDGGLVTEFTVTSLSGEEMYNSVSIKAD